MIHDSLLNIENNNNDIGNEYLTLAMIFDTLPMMMKKLSMILKHCQCR
jgi:hypothetical protein